MTTTSPGVPSSSDTTAAAAAVVDPLESLLQLEAEQLRVYAAVEDGLDLVLRLLAQLRAQPLASDRALTHAAVVMMRAVDLYAALPGMPELEPLLIERMKELTQAMTRAAPPAA